MARPGSNAGRSSSVTEVGDRFGREGPAMVRTMGMALVWLGATLGLAAPGFAQTAVPNWNVTVPADPGHAVQRVTLTATAITIDRTFSENKAHVVIPLETIASVSEPYFRKGAWAIDLELSKPAKLVSVLNIGPTDTLKTSEYSVLFLTKDDAAAAKAYLLGKLGPAR